VSHVRVRISQIDGLPVALAFAHCDDFFLHGPTHEKARLAGLDFVDLVLKVGLLAHPEKLSPPSQKVKYTGFIWNTEDIPTLQIPPYKVDKSLVLIDYALDHRDNLSRPCLAVSSIPCPPDQVTPIYGALSIHNIPPDGKVYLSIILLMCYQKRTLTIYNGGEGF
jgi:hypothetical protein